MEGITSSSLPLVPPAAPLIAPPLIPLGLDTACENIFNTFIFAAGDWTEHKRAVPSTPPRDKHSAGRVCCYGYDGDALMKPINIGTMAESVPAFTCSSAPNTNCAVGASREHHIRGLIGEAKHTTQDGILMACKNLFKNRIHDENSGQVRTRKAIG